MRLSSRLVQFLAKKIQNGVQDGRQNAGYSISLEIIDIESGSLALYIGFWGQEISL